MITLPKYHGETAVFGLGRSGLSVVRALVAAGNRVSAWDQNGDQRAVAEKAGAQIRDLETEFGAPARLVVSHGVPLTNPRTASTSPRFTGLGPTVQAPFSCSANDEVPSTVMVVGTRSEAHSTGRGSACHA